MSMKTTRVFAQIINRTKLLWWFSTSFLSSVVFAVSTSSTTSFLQLEKLKLNPTKASSNSIFNLKSLIESQHYLSPANEQDKNESSQYTEVYADYFLKNSTYDFKTAVAFATYFKPGESYYAVYDLYGGYRASENLRFNLGRKQMNWSYLDSSQNVGLWQPKFALDPLRQKQQGLTGVSTEYEGRIFSFRALYSPLHIPSIGSDLKVKNGKFVTSNRWSRPPSNRLNFLRPENQNQIDYSLEVGNLSKLIYHQVQTYQMRLQSEVGLFTQASWAKKPINDILVLRQDYKAANGDDTANVNLRPTVGYHELGTVEAGFETEGFRTKAENSNWDFRFVASSTQDRPARSETDQEQWVVQQPLKADIYGAQMDLRANSLKTKPTLSLAYTKINGGKFIDLKPNGSVDDFVTFEYRFLFYDYFVGSLDFNLAYWDGQPFNLKASYLYDQKQKGSMISSVLSFLSKKQWGAHLGFDILGVENENSDKTFLNSFRANDRFYGGLNYVF